MAASCGVVSFKEPEEMAGGGQPSRFPDINERGERRNMAVVAGAGAGAGSQCDTALFWLQSWDNATRCDFMEEILNRCKGSKTQYLRSVMEPLLHRDFLMASAITFPHIAFSSVSTPQSRSLESNKKMPHSNSFTTRRVKACDLNLTAIKEEKTDLHHRVPTWKSGGDAGSSAKEEAVVLDWFDHWSEHECTLFINHVLTALDKRQLYFTVGQLAKRQYRDFIADLPANLAIKILSNLSAVGLCRAACVSKTWNKLSTNDILWENICKAKNISTSRSRLMQLKWKKVFSKQLKLQANWLQGRYSIATLKGHSHRVLCVKFLDNMIVSGSVDKTVRIWDLSTCECKHIFRGHQRGVWSVAFKNKNSVVSGSFDGEIRIWNLAEGKQQSVLLGHRSSVWCLRTLLNNYMLSSSRDKTIRLWNLTSGICKRKFTGHKGSVYCVDANEAGTMVSGSADKTIRIWNQSTGECLSVYDQFTHAVLCLEVRKWYCAVGDKNTFVIINLNTMQPTDVTYCGHHGRIESIGMRVVGSDPFATNQISGSVVTCSRDKTIKLFNILTGECLQTYKSHNAVINAIDFNESLVVSAGDDDRIKVWNFESEKNMNNSTTSKKTHSLTKATPKLPLSSQWSQVIYNIAQKPIHDSTR